MLVCCLASCASIREYRDFEQPLGSQLEVSVGGVMLRMNRLSDLPNVFGGRDIYGGKVDRGFAEIRLVAIEGTTLVLEVADIRMRSSETTLDRYKVFEKPSAIDVDVNVNQSVASDSTGAPKSYVVRLDTQQQRDFVVAGARVTFQSVQPYSVRYVVEDLQPTS